MKKEYYLVINNANKIYIFIDFYKFYATAGREVSVDKTTVTQRMLHTIKSQGVNMYKLDEKVAMLTKHLKNVRIMDMEDDGQMYQVATRVGPDHLGCALIYALIGKDKLLAYNTKKDIGMEFI